MDEYINRNELIENLNRFAPEHYNALINQLITKQPTADVEKVKHGEWKLHKDGSGTCSVCGRHQKHIWDMCSWQKYCGHCGAKMDGGKEE